MGQVGTLTGWKKHTGDQKVTKCTPRKLGLPILGRRECSKSNQILTDDVGCVGVLGANNMVCKVRKLA